MVKITKMRKAEFEIKKPKIHKAVLPFLSSQYEVWKILFSGQKESQK